MTRDEIEKAVRETGSECVGMHEGDPVSQPASPPTVRMVMAAVDALLPRIEALETYERARGIAAAAVRKSGGKVPVREVAWPASTIDEEDDTQKCRDCGKAGITNSWTHHINPDYWLCPECAGAKKTQDAGPVTSSDGGEIGRAPNPVLSPASPSPAVGWAALSGDGGVLRHCGSSRAWASKVAAAGENVGAKVVALVPAADLERLERVAMKCLDLTLENAKLKAERKGRGEEGDCRDTARMVPSSAPSLAELEERYEEAVRRTDLLYNPAPDCAFALERTAARALIDALKDRVKELERELHYTDQFAMRNAGRAEAAEAKLAKIGSKAEEVAGEAAPGGTSGGAPKVSADVAGAGSLDSLSRPASSVPSLPEAVTKARVAYDNLVGFVNEEVWEALKTERAAVDAAFAEKSALIEDLRQTIRDYDVRVHRDAEEIARLRYEVEGRKTV